MKKTYTLNDIQLFFKLNDEFRHININDLTILDKHNTPIIIPEYIKNGMTTGYNLLDFVNRNY